MSYNPGSKLTENTPLISSTSTTTLLLPLTPSAPPSTSAKPLPDMVPPFLAYYGVVNDNSSLIQEAYTQCELYRRYLRTPETGLWRHIIWGTSPDDGLWATGAFRCSLEE